VTGDPLTDADVPGVWQQLGLPGLADIHVHFMPPSMLAAVWKYFDNATQNYGVEWPISYRTSDEDRLATLGELGVRRTPTLCYAHKPGMAAWLNDWCAAFAAQHDEVVHSATFYPEEGVEKYVRAALDDGARVFKIHVQVGEFDPSEPALDPVWGMLADASRPVVVHCGSGPISGPHTGPEKFGEVLRRFNDLTAVIAHAGAPEYAEHLEFVRRYPNVHLDTTMVGTPFMQRRAPLPPAVLRRYRDLGHRIVFGSDFPNIPYDYATQVQALLDWDFGDDWLRDVLWHNGARLMNLDG